MIYKWFCNTTNSRKLFFRSTLFKPSLYISSSVPVSWLSHHTAVRLDLRLLLSSSCFHTQHPAGMEGEREREVLEVKLPLFHTSVSLSLPLPSRPPSLPPCFASDGLIYSLKRSGGGKMISYIFFKEKRWGLALGAIMEKIRIDGWCVQGCLGGLVEGRICFTAFFFFLTSHCGCTSLCQVYLWRHR